MLRKVLATAILILGLIGALGPRTGQVYAQTPRPAADLKALYHEHILAINRGDLAGVMAGYAADATFIGPGAACNAAAPCIGKEAIQGLFQALIASHLLAGIVDLQASGDTVTGSINFITDSIKAGGYGTVRAKITVTFSGDKIVRDVVEHDLSDPGTAAYANFVQLTGLLRQHYDAVNQGDVEAALAIFASDAVVIRGNRCPQARPCVGSEALRQQLEQEKTLQVRVTVVSIQGTGDSIVLRLELRNIPIRNAGLERVVQVHTVTFKDDQVVRLTAVLDLSDPQSAQFDNVARVTTRSTSLRNAALNRGDVAGVMAIFAEDAVYEGWGQCTPNPCLGKAAIQREIEREVADHTQVANDPLTVRVSGDILTVATTFVRSDSIRAAGVERVVVSTTAEVKGEKITLLRYVLNVEDAQTATFLAAQPAALPRTGEQPLFIPALLAAVAGCASLAIGLGLRRQARIRA